jgi:hypothetical protein
MRPLRLDGGRGGGVRAMWRVPPGVIAVLRSALPRFVDACLLRW